MSERRQYKELVSGLAGVPVVTIGGTDYAGSYLAMLVAVNPNQAVEEAAATPQLICELGRILAVAYRAKQRTEVEYRVWRDGIVHHLTNDLTGAIKAGFACSADPGVDAKGKEKPPKLPSVSAVETYVRTLPEYVEHYSAMTEAEESWATLHIAVEAAKQRTWAIRHFDDNQDETDVRGGTRIDSVEAPSRSAPPPPPQVARRS